MPDHIHLMWLGVKLESDQLNGMRFLRTQLNRLLAGKSLSGFESAANLRSQPRVGWRLQPQAFDHVLREEERKQGAFVKVCFYILANPVRAGLVERESDWTFNGTIVPGYPEAQPLQEGFWEWFWKVYCKFREPVPTKPGKLD